MNTGETSLATTSTSSSSSTVFPFRIFPIVRGHRTIATMKGHDVRVVLGENSIEEHVYGDYRHRTDRCWESFSGRKNCKRTAS